MKFFQACYGKPDDLRWSLYDLSPDITSEMCDFYERIANNDAIQNIAEQELRDENRQNKTLDLYEVNINERLVCISRSLYSAEDVDRDGRRKMVSRGFLCTTEDNLMKDPSLILSVSENNFNLQAEETVKIPKTLIYDEPLNVESAMGQTGLKHDTYMKLMGCVYQMIQKVRYNKIYIVSSDKNNNIKPISYCIYSGLPYSLRYQISIANADKEVGNNGKTILFVDDIAEREPYINIDTGETNIQWQDVVENEGEFPFFKELANYGLELFGEFCEEFETNLAKLKLDDVQDYDALTTAYFIIHEKQKMDTMNEKELLIFASELSVRSPFQNDFVDDIFADIISRMMNEKIPCNEMLLKRFEKRTLVTKVEDFREGYEVLKARNILENGADSVCTCLQDARNQNMDEFEKWRGYFSNADVYFGYDEEQTEYVIGYIVQYYNNLIGNCISMEQIHNLTLEVTAVPKIAMKTMRPIKERAYQITYGDILKEPKGENYCRNILKKYANWFGTFCSEYMEIYNQDIDNIKKLYWKHFDMHTFRFTNEYFLNYRFMKVKSDKTYEMVECLYELWETVQKIQKKETQKLISEAESTLAFIDEHYENEKILAVIEIVQDMIWKYLKKMEGRHFLFWRSAASFGVLSGAHQNPYELMIQKWKLDILWDDDCFYRSLNSSRLSEKLGEVLKEIEGGYGSAGYLENLEPKSDAYYLLEQRLKLWKELYKNIQKFAAHPEAVVLDKKEKSVEDDSTSKSIFSKWGRKKK